MNPHTHARTKYERYTEIKVETSAAPETSDPLTDVVRQSEC